MKLVSNSQKSTHDVEEISSQFSSPISSMIDGELTDDEVRGEIHQLLSGGRGREQWQRYHLIRDLLQQRLPQAHNLDFTRQVMAKLDSEATVLAPGRAGRTLTQQLIGLGLAASVAAMALFGTYMLNSSSGTQPIQMVAEAKNSDQKNPKDVAQWRRGPDLEQFSPYLANHAASSAGSGRQGFVPYARVVGYSNER